eukprot:9082585-Pyramimonas_sp.AAC.1
MIAVLCFSLPPAVISRAACLAEQEFRATYRPQPCSAMQMLDTHLHHFKLFHAIRSAMQRLRDSLQAR